MWTSSWRQGCMGRTRTCRPAAATTAWGFSCTAMPSCSAACAGPRRGHLGAPRGARRRVEDVAEDLLRLYSKREAKPGFSFSQDTPWQAELEASFPYEETPDQLQALAEIKADMESERPMDRLLCGDVGFGKTEVALRAAFKAVMSGRQVALLAPTTVLSQQHFQVFSERLSNFPVTV